MAARYSSRCSIQGTKPDGGTLICTTSSETKFTPGEHPDLRPPPGTVGFVGWIRQNLFPSVTSSILTVLSIYLLYLIIPPLIDWVFLDAQVSGNSRTDCTNEGACWALLAWRWPSKMA